MAAADSPQSAIPAVSPSRPSVAVLCSTFNGSAYLPSLVESIDRQSHRASLLAFRDDGSNDTTRRYLGELAAARSDVVVEEGEHVGINRSFFSLLDASGSKTDYVAFADQDDFWFPDKLERAVGALAQVRDRPAMWCSRLMIADMALNPLRPTRAINKPSLGNAFVENIAAGCTIVLNQQAVRLLSNPPKEGILYYDWWCYLACAAFGSIIADNRPSVLYRLHNSNSVGLVRSRSLALAAKLKRKNPVRLLSELRGQVAAFLARYGDELEADSLGLAKRFAQRDRRLAFDRRVFRRERVDDALLRAALMIGL